jgi:hypoxanthine phosphoribosyltransferase
LIVEDIVDTGLTLTWLRRTLGERNPHSLRTVTLLDKAARRIIPVPLEHRGFEIPDVFVVGYGMDFHGRYRNVPEILAVNDLARLTSEPLVLCEQVFANAG